MLSILLAALLALAPSRKRVAYHEFCLDAFRDSRCAPWYRPTDPIMGEMYLLVGDGRWACVVSPEEYVLAQDGQEWECEWRPPRGW